MCRLFGLSAGTVPVRATFWLLDAPDSLEVESRRNADGSGIGYFDSAGEAVLDKQPEAAYRDREFSREAKEVSSPVFVAHVRYATAGGRTVQNTHPFTMLGRVMAHNGGIGEVDRLEAELGQYRDLVQGDTDSERYFALITKEIDGHGGDVGAGMAAAARWIGANLPVSSLNAVVIAPGEMWALRYPDVRALHVIERPAGQTQGRTGQHAADPAGDGRPGLHVRSSTSSVRVPDLDAIPSVVVASEELDGESGWRMLEPGELLHIRPDLTVRSQVGVAEPPVRPMQPSGPDPNIDT